VPAGRPPKPLERQKADARGDGLRPGGHKPGQALVVSRQGSLDIPDPPEGLAERGTIEWRKIWQAGRAWLHPAEDYHWIEQIAHAYDDIAEFRKEIENTGLIVKGYAGQQTANPLLREISDQQATIRKCLSMLGFSPTDRARLGLAEIKVRSALADQQDKQRRNREKPDGPKRAAKQ
jgi:P27 family predicted phage terminase small subunit